MQSALLTASKWILIHRYFGLVVVAVFLGTGMFMRFHEPPMEDLNNSVRVLYRSAHIYLLMSGLLNFAFGLAPFRKETIISRIGSIFLLISPVLIFLGFCLESSRTIIDRPITAMGVYLVFAGSLIRGISLWRMLRFII
jgi:hypothetical protein